jgi:general secretion pathway protein A
MYQSHFGLREAPFSIAPNPRYLYMSQRHQEALAHLLYGLGGGGGFVLLTGEVGAGKTTICRCLLEQIPESCDVAYIFNPKLTAIELLSTICAEFQIALPVANASIKVFIDCINAYLLSAHANGRSTVLIIDEAQNLAVDVMEQMRLLTNLETNQRKLLQIILIGQPELATMLERQDLRQLAQRIVARYHLGPLTKPEVAAYVGHRLDVSGGRRQLIPEALAGSLYRLSRGVPRVINVLCDRALLGAFTKGQDRVSRSILSQAASEVFCRPEGLRRSWMLPLSVILTLTIVLWVATVVQRYQEHVSARRVKQVNSVSAMWVAPVATHDATVKGAGPHPVIEALPLKPGEPVVK